MRNDREWYLKLTFYFQLNGEALWIQNLKLTHKLKKLNLDFHFSLTDGAMNPKLSTRELKILTRNLKIS